MTTKIYHSNEAAACFFRSTATLPDRKIILQITEKCNLHCKHCFVSSTVEGHSMNLDRVKSILPILKEAQVSRVTLTGGEPFCNSCLSEIVDLLTQSDINVSICTNATLITEAFLEHIANKKRVHFNISLDGYKSESHGMFRGNTSPTFIERILSNIALVANFKMLNGILSTPNKYASIDEYKQICEFARSIKARYVLFNPLSEYGRGQDTVNLGFSSEQMRKLKLETQSYNSEDFEVVYIRFRHPSCRISKCPKGSVPYVFVDGTVAVCPYLVFASNDTVSQYSPKSFTIGNIFEDGFNLISELDNYRFPISEFSPPEFCDVEGCSGGCYAAKISRGKLLTDCDMDMCPLEE